MRLKRPRRIGLAIGSAVGVFYVSGPAAALVTPPVKVPELPSVPLPQVSVPSVTLNPPPVHAPSVTLPPVSSSVPNLPAVSQLRSSLPVGSSGGDAGRAPAPDVGVYRPSVAGDPVPSSAAGRTGADSGSETGSASSRAGAAALRASTARAAASPEQARRTRRPAAAERQLRQAVESLSGCLPSVPAFEATVLSLRAGLGPGNPLSSSQVTGRLGVAPASVQGAERRGVRSLRQANRATGCGAGVVRGRSSGFAFRFGQPLLASLGGRLGSGGAAITALSTRTSHRTSGASAAPRTSAIKSHGRDAARPAFGDGGGASHASISSERWILVLVGLTTLGGVLVVLARRRVPAARRGGTEGATRRRTSRTAKVDLYCSYCQSRRVAINPTRGIYRCVHCGFRGALPPAFLAEVVNMHEDGTSRDAAGVGRGSTKR